MYRLLSLLLLGALMAPSVTAQVNGELRSRTSGNWSDPATWEEYSGGTWSIPRRAPRATTEGPITISPGDIVIGDQRGTFDEVTIATGATLRVTDRVSIDDGAGTDLNVYGTLIVDRQLTVQGTATAIFQPGSSVSITAGNELRFVDSATGTLSTGTVLTSAGTLRVDNTAVLTFDAGSTFYNNDTVLLRSSGQLIMSDSRLVNSGTFTTQQSGFLVMDVGSIFEQAVDGGSLPAASNTQWLAGSTMLFSGTATQLPGNLDHTFQTVIWDATGQTGALSLDAAFLGIQEDFLIQSTGTGALVWDPAGAPLTVGGDLVLSAGATLDVASATGTPTVSVGGDVLIDGTLLTGPGNPATLVLNGTAVQTLAVTSVISGPFDISVAGPGGVVLGADLTVNGSITETAGGFDMAGMALTLSGSLSVTTALTNPGPITMTGTGTQTLSSAAPPLILDALTVDMPGGSLLLTSDVEATGPVVVRAGTLDMGGFRLIIPEGGTFLNLGASSGPVVMSRTYTGGEGWRMITSPVSGPTYSSLNTAFYTQGTAWASDPNGSPNLMTFDPASQSWNAVGDADAGLAPGGAYILYAFESDLTGTPLLPATFTVEGTPGTGSPVALHHDAVIGDTYNFMGNPGTANMDWDETVAASTDIGSAYATWDPALTAGGGTTGYAYYDAATGLGSAGPYIAPFTAFMVAATSAAATLVPVHSEAASLGSAVSFGKGSGTPPHIRLQVNGQGLAERDMYLIAGQEHGVRRLAPLSSDWTTLWTAPGDTALAYEGRTWSESHTMSFDLYHAATKSGTYRLSWPDVKDLDEDIRIHVIDLTSGKRVDMRNEAELTFQIRAEDRLAPGSTLPASASPRFRVVLSRADAVDSDVTAPDQLTLAQNFPNPFNPSTTIRYAVQEAGHVRLQVFDALGRRVAVLVDGPRAAGWNAVTWQAGHLTSGLYIYRLDVGAQSVSKTMLLLK